MMNKHRTNFDKHWSYHQILRLIDLFRANDVLWDKWNKEYHKNLVKQNVWKDIAAKLGNKTVGSCRTKMENLMTVYRRTKKNLEISIAKGKPVNPTWPYFNHFEVFMKDQFGSEMPTDLDNHQQNFDSQSSDLQYLDPSNNSHNDFELEDSKAFLQISYSPPTFEENHNHHQQQQQQDQFTTNHQNNHHQHLVNHNQQQQEVEEDEDGEVVVEEEPIGNCQLQLIESRVLASANVAASHHHQPQNHQPHSNSNQQQPTQTSTSSSKRKRSSDNPSSTLSMKNVFDIYQERIQNEPDIVRRSEERIQFLETKLELIEQKHRDELERAKLDYQKELRIQKEIINSIYSEKIQFLEQACKELRKEKNELFQVVIKRLS